MARRAKPQFNRDLRRFSSWQVDQVFLRRDGGRIQANVWFVSSENEVRNERFFVPHTDPVEAVAWLGDVVAAKGKIGTAFDVRLRWASDEQFQTKLEDDQTLEDVFIDAFETALEDVRSRMR